MTIVLPPSRIGANSPYFKAFDSYQQIDMMGNSAVYRMWMEQFADEWFRIDRFKAGDWKSALSSSLQWGKDEALLDFEKAAMADAYVAKKIASVEDAMTLSQRAPADILRTFDNELSGSVYSPIAALFHFIKGTGTPMWTNINNLNLHFELEEFQPVANAMRDASQGLSSFSIEKHGYNTGNDSLITVGYLGNITLKVEGSISKSGEAAAFNGVVRAWNDTYDANSGNYRTESAEFSTRVLRQIQEMSPAQPFEIRIVGEVPVHFRN